MSIWSKNLPARNEGFYALQKEVNDFFDAATRDSFLTGTAVVFQPKLEIKEDEKTYKITAELPGMKEEDIQVTLKDNCLILEGEKKNEYQKEEKGYYKSEISYGSFYRSIPFAAEVCTEKVSAIYKDGQLKVEVEKLSPPNSKSRKITVKRA